MTIHVQSAVTKSAPNGNPAIHVLTHAAAKMRMFNAVTEWDKKQSTKKGYNVFALGHYARALTNIDELMEDEKLSLREAIIRSFCGRLRDVVLKSVGQLPAEKSEQPRMSWR